MPTTTTPITTIPKKSNFHHDLQQEQILGRFLDKGYHVKFPNGNLIRIHDNASQNAGVDLEYHCENSSKVLTVDEKAQLSYLNNSLPTFAFELSYLKNGNMKQGWLFDTHKKTDFYFLITAIYLKNKKDKLEHEDDIKSCLVTKVCRQELIHYLARSFVTNPTHAQFLNRNRFHQLDEATCLELSHGFRAYAANKGVSKIALNDYINIHYSKHLAEQPVNFVIKLNHLAQTLTKVTQVEFYAVGASVKTATVS